MTVGRASVLCAMTLVATSIFTIFVCSSLPPLEIGGDDVLNQAVARQIAPLNTGFMRMFGMPYWAASVLSIPATFATAFGFTYGYGRVILSMARSGLFPPILVRTYGEYKTAFGAIIFGSIISYLVVILAFFVPSIQAYLFNVCIMAGYTAYTSQLVGFLLFRIRHPDQERRYTSPLGMAGAVYPIIVFTLCAISVMGFQNDDSVSFIIYLIIILVSTAHYFLYAKSRQFFSPEEKFIFIMQIVKCKFNFDKTYWMNKSFICAVLFLIIFVFIYAVDALRFPSQFFSLIFFADQYYQFIDYLCS